jgi:hypothetical protein
MPFPGVGCPCGESEGFGGGFGCRSAIRLKRGPLSLAFLPVDFPGAGVTGFAYRAPAALAHRELRDGLRQRATATLFGFYFHLYIVHGASGLLLDHDFPAMKPGG